MCLSSLDANMHPESAKPMPRLCSTYLPFRTQHRILTFVQTILEECCLDFGKTWFPALMEASKWDEAESIELTQWIKTSCKHIESLPSSATRPIADKSLNQVLFETSSLRHSAVHRIPTNVMDIMNMLQAAWSFAKTLDDTVRAAQIVEIKEQLATSVVDLVRRQKKLCSKLSDQLEDLARRRAEIDELERLGIEDMRRNNENLRIEAGSAIENVIAGLQQVPGPSSFICTEKFETTNAVRTPGEPKESFKDGLCPLPQYFVQ